MGIMAYTKRGIAPADPTTDVGKFRFAAGDSEYQEYDPVQPGFGLYQLWSDADITGLLAVSGGSIAKAVSLAYLQIGATYAASGATIKTDDLSVSVKDSVGNWLNLANFWRQVAEDEAANGANDMFELVRTGSPSFPDCDDKPEASPWPLAHFGFSPGQFRW